MDTQTRSLLNTLLILLLALLQFLLRVGPQNAQAKALDQRLAEAEARLESLEQQSPQ